ncbi:MAG: nif-specific transcriptional activator NifA [Ancalomicrobiaceae bacterium]|nr:nif-specific transcriptional activator NifA [Ancalomicrobiaceae bacterium]
MALSLLEADSPAVTTLVPRATPRTARTSAEMALFGIYEISKILATPMRLEVTLASVANILTSFLQMRRGVIVVLDGDGEPEIVATGGVSRVIKGKTLKSIPQPVIDRIVATATPVVVQDVASDPMFAEADWQDGDDRPAETRVSFIGVPIKGGNGQVLGTLSIDRVWDGSVVFRLDEDLRFLAMVANLVGQSVRMHRILAADRQRLIDEQNRLEKALHTVPARPTPRMGGIVGDSRPIKRVMERIAIVAPTNSTVLLRGESGTGKEMFARAIHELSRRKAKPFIKLNCAAMAESVLESELFGHEKGAFTGALATKPGRFEMAHGGSLLLDEIGEISPAFQSKLLRVLQEGEFERVGGTKTLKVDVRLICATNKDLEDAVRKGEFRADLYYRINVVPIFLPALRDRPGDIPLLAHSFLDRFNAENGRRLQFTKSGTDLISKCYFPGNVRELENCIRRTATLAPGEVLGRDDFACAHGECLSAVLWTGIKRHEDDPVSALAAGEGIRPLGSRPQVHASAPPSADAAEAHVVAEVDHGSHACEHAGGGDCPALQSRLTEKERLIDAMERSGWVQAKAARLLDLTPRQIGYALKKYNIEMKRF